MIVTDREEIAGKNDPDFLENMRAFDSSGKRLAVAGSEESMVLTGRGASEPQEAELKEKISAFWRLSGNPIQGLEAMTLDEAVKASVDWLKIQEWKTYRRGGKLFWTLMLPCGIIPFAIGLFKIPMSAKGVGIYIGCFVASILLIVGMRRILYAKPEFPEPKKNI